VPRIIAIGAGHDIPSDLGKVIFDGKIKEFFLNQRIALVSQEDLIDRGYIVHDFEGNLIRKKIPWINTVNAIASVEIHHNAHNHTKIQGAETIYHPKSLTGRIFADVVIEAIAEEGFRVNGVKQGWYRYNPKSKKFYAFTSKIWSASIIVECAYLTNKYDLDVIQQKDYSERMGRAIARGVNYYVKTYVT
jgi:N-acetylmuramoyl-L-alanine amidase